VHTEDAILLLDQVDDPRVASRILRSQGVLRADKGDLEGAERDFSRALEMLEGLPMTHEVASGVNNLAMLKVVSGRAMDALEGAEQALSMLADIPDRIRARPTILHTKGAALLALNRVAEAWDCYLSGLESAAEYGNCEVAVALLQGLACAAAQAGRAELCLELLAAAQASSQMAGVRDRRIPATPAEDAKRGSWQALGDGLASEAWARGLRMDLRAALEHARAIGRLEPLTPLTPRKTEIVRMVAVGLSNKEIGQRMSISERTVEAHLEQVRNQLGFNNRAQLAAWVVARGLETA
jgi:non-specific serine/threonine protein kinase